jgi:phosphoglycolate phosphatase
LNAARPLRSIAIDLDGTLVDSAPDLAAAVNATLAGMKLRLLPEPLIRSMIGDGIDTLLARAMQASLGRPPARSELDRARPAMREQYAAAIFKRGCIYEGVRETLSGWRENGLKLACVTNKASTLTGPLLAQAGLDDYFDAVFCADLAEERKPDPCLLLRVLAEFQHEPEQSLMIGDSSHDVHAAQRAGMDVIAVSYGYGTPVSENGLPVTRVDRFADIAPLLTPRLEVSQC